MGVFNRVRDIVTANVNALLDKAEDPAKMLRLMIQEMEDTIIELKSSCTAQIAEKKTATREQKEIEEKIVQWGDRAALAIEKDREDLAKEALIEKRNWVDKKSGIDRHVDLVTESVELSRSDIIKLEKKLISVKSKYKELATRSKQAENSNRVKFHEMERQVDKMEARFDMEFSGSGTLEDEFSKLEEGESINDELEELKKRIKRGE